ncbi:fungal-specific transcription factor domain-containing protein [Aspergillus carlsbadensis]|nr:fungal-specific transcription factor domain-containing protein [Aspergillus carlsbadensis]
MNTLTPDELHSATPQRRRIRLACQPCQLRKRKCDGHEPCDSCSRYDYNCLYEHRPRRKRARRHGAAEATAPIVVAAQTAEAITPEKPTTTPEDKCIEANCGVAFPHVLVLSLSPQDAPKLQGLGWNLGIRSSSNPSEKSIVWILRKEDWKNLFDIYVSKVHPVYNFLHLPEITTHAARRWEDPCATNHYDSILCGIAALGSLFSSLPLCSSEQERQLVECAKEILETTSTIVSPTYYDAEGWVLRTLYLRCNSTPHAAWVASCTAMHIIEAIGLHRESTTRLSLGYSDAGTAGLESERRRRLFWVAKLLNTWISFEYGRSRVVVQGESCEYLMAAPKAESETETETKTDATADLLSIFRISESLDPGQAVATTNLEELLQKLCSYEFTSNGAVILSQSVLAFTIYRRLRLSSPSLDRSVIDQVIQLGRKGLDACARCIVENCPWWHVTYVPFQFTCVLLAMDTSEAFLCVRDCLETLKRAADFFRTDKPSRASEAAKLLVKLAQRQKEQDAAMLCNAVDGDTGQRTDNSSIFCQRQSIEGGGGDENGHQTFAWFDSVLTGQAAPDGNDLDAFIRDPLDFSVDFSSTFL